MVLHASSLLLGVVVGLGAVLEHRADPPLGLLLALVTSVAVPVRLLVSHRPRVAASYALGWLVVLAVAFAGRPEGDYALAGDLDGYLLVAGSVPVLGIGVVSLPGRRSAGS